MPLMNRYNLVIFDLDGTLADTSPGIYNSIRYVQNMLNLHPITDEQMRSHIGPPMEESYNRNFGLTGDDLKKAVEYHKEYAIKQGYKELKLYDGIAELIDALKLSGIKMAIVTLKAQTTAIKIFDALRLSDKFDIIIGADPAILRTKSQMLEYCMETLRVNKRETVLIGDSRYDAMGAFDAGIDFVAVTYGFGFSSKYEAMQYKSVACFNSIKEVDIFLRAKQS